MSVETSVPSCWPHSSVGTALTALGICSTAVTCRRSDREPELFTGRQSGGLYSRDSHGGNGAVREHFLVRFTNRKKNRANDRIPPIPMENKSSWHFFIPFSIMDRTSNGSASAGSLFNLFNFYSDHHRDTTNAPPRGNLEQIMHTVISLFTLFDIVFLAM